MKEEGNRVSVVTGGSMGIGRSICTALGQPGDVVVFNHYDPDDGEAEKTVARLKERGVETWFEKFDVSDPQAVKAFLDQVIERHGRLDNMINNAGITQDTLLVRMTLEQFERVLKVNLTGVFICLQAAAKLMMKQRSGSIVNVASIVGQIGNPGQANYSASKAGVMALTKTAAKELAGRGVRVNAVAPGFIETAMTAQLPPKVVDFMMSMIPTGEFGQPEDVADVIAFLCSDAARYLTGQVIHVSGGMYM